VSATAATLPGPADAGFRNLPPKTAAAMALNGYRVSQIVYVVASLDIVDRLAARPMSCAELATECGVDADALARLLRAAAALGLLSEDPHGTYRTTALSTPLRIDARPSLREAALMLGREWHWGIWGDVVATVRTGEAAFPRLFGRNWREYRALHRDEAVVFRAAIEALLALDVAVVLSLFDFGAYRVLVYPAFHGGCAGFLGSLLRGHPDQRAIVLELPEFADLAGEELEREGIADRCVVVPQEPLTPFPRGGDAYVLRHVLSYHGDEDALALLRHGREALSRDGRLLVVATIVPPRNEFGLAKLIDLEGMLMSPVAGERTETEYRELLSAAGLRIRRIHTSPAPTSVIEAEKA
jgi:hypothetical protein